MDDPPRHRPRGARDAGFDRPRCLCSDEFRQAEVDGNWSVLIVTEKGTCDRAYRYPVKIENGSVGYAGSASFTVTGKVGEKGAVTVTVARGSQSATGRGTLSLTDGAGRWTAASGGCSGTWTAERRS